MKILLVGGGWIAETVYVPFLSDIQSIKWIDVLDPNSQTIATRFSKYPKVNCLFHLSDIEYEYDLIFILSPNYLHFKHLKTYVRKNTKILVEKPICIFPEEAKELQAIVDESKASIHVSAPLRYRTDMQMIKEIVTKNTLGTIYHTEISWLKRRGTPGSAWFTQKKFAGGGVLMDMGPHILDLYFWLFGDQKTSKSLGCMSSHFLTAKDAYADWHSGDRLGNETDVEDNSFTLLTFKNSSLMMKLAWASNIINDYAQIKLFGTRGTLDVLTSIGFSTNTLYKETQFNLTIEGVTSITVLPIEDRKEPFRKMLHNFILDEYPSLPSAHLALNVINIILNLYQVSETI